MLAPVLALALSWQDQQSGFTKASELFAQCQADVRYQDQVRVSQADAGDARHCIGYIQGFTDGADLKSYSICLGAATYGTLSRVYVAYLEKNPKFLDIPCSTAFLFALTEAYPCSTNHK